MIVVDSSVLVHALTNSTSLGDQANGRLRDESIAAPGRIDLETLNAIKQLERGRIIAPDEAQAIFKALSSLPLIRYEHWPFLERCWELRHNLSVYDSSFVALAEALESTLVTTDKTFAKVSGISCAVELITGA